MATQNYEGLYGPSYEANDGVLWKKTVKKSGLVMEKLCNFTPFIRREITQDDGVETTTKVALCGLHESGRELPEIEIDAAELAAFNWLPEHWGMDCILEIGRNVKDNVRYAIQTTAKHAEHRTVYTVTGWRKLDGR